MVLFLPSGCVMEGSFGLFASPFHLVVSGSCPACRSSPIAPMCVIIPQLREVVCPPSLCIGAKFGQRNVEADGSFDGGRQACGMAVDLIVVNCSRWTSYLACDRCAHSFPIGILKQTETRRGYQGVHLKGKGGANGQVVRSVFGMVRLTYRPVCCQVGCCQYQVNGRFACSAFKGDRSSGQ